MRHFKHAIVLLQKIRFSCSQNQCKKLHQFSDHENWFFCKANILQFFSYFENAIAFLFHWHTSRKSFAMFIPFPFSHRSEIWSMSRENWSLGAFIFLDADICSTSNFDEFWMLTSSFSSHRMHQKSIHVKFRMSPNRSHPESLHSKSTFAWQKHVSFSGNRISFSGNRISFFKSCFL